MNKVVIGVIAAIAVAAVGAAVGTAYFVKKSKRKLDVLDGVFDKDVFEQPERKKPVVLFVSDGASAFDGEGNEILFDSENDGATAFASAITAHEEPYYLADFGSAVYSDNYSGQTSVIVDGLLVDKIGAIDFIKLLNGAGVYHDVKKVIIAYSGSLDDFINTHVDFSNDLNTDEAIAYATEEIKSSIDGYLRAVDGEYIITEDMTSDVDDIFEKDRFTLDEIVEYYRNLIDNSLI